MSWLMKTGLVLLLTLAATVSMSGGWFNPATSHAAVSWQATGTVAQGTGALTVAWPTHQAGDVALLFVETPNVAATLTTPNGFVEVANSPQLTGTANTAGGTRLTVYWARATYSAMPSPVLAAVADHQIAVIVTFSGVRAIGDPYDATAGSVKAAASTSTTFPTVTTTAANNLVVLAAAVDLDAASTAVWSAFANAALTGITERFDQAIATGVGGGLGIATAVKATAGATGTTTGTLTSSITTQMTISLIAGSPYYALASCGECHGFKSPTAFTDSAARDGISGNFPGSHNGHVQVSGITCSVCHTAPATETAADYKHANGTVEIAAAISGGTYGKASYATTNSFSPASCNTVTCHGTLSPVWGSANAGCSTCHSDTTATTTFTTTARTTNSPSSTIHVSHLNRTHNISTGVITCASCHTVPVTVGDVGHNDSPLPAEAALVGYNGTTCSTATACHNSKAPSWSIMLNSTISDCSKCHDLPPSPGTGTHASIPSAITTIAGLSACSSLSTGCHPTIAAAPTTYANIFADVTKHINGTIEGGSCTGCHAAGGSGAAGTRLAITEQFGSTYSHHYQGAAAVDGKVCYACHWEADSAGSTTASHQGTPGGTVDLVIWDTNARPTTNTPGATSVAYTSGGATTTAIAERAKINSHCIGCHSDTNKTTQPFSASTDTGTPAKYAWDTQSIGAKWLSTATTPWGKFTGNFTNSKSTQTKAFSAHNNAANNARGWNTLAETLQGTAVVSNYSNTSGGTAVPCFDCHNSHGSLVSDLVATTNYNSVIAKKGGILKRTTAGKGGYTYAYTPGAAGTTAQKNAHNAGAGLCFDCHSNAAANATTESGSKTVTGYGDYGATQAIIGYNDTPYFGKTGGVFPKTLTFSYTTLTGNTGTYNAGRAMSTNAGGHFGASATMTATPAGTIGGLCTPCHDPHGVSSTITTPANAVPLLKGTYVTSPYKTDAAGTAQLRGGGSKAASQNAFIAGYHIDQNTLQANRSMKPTAQQSSWLFTTSAKSLQNLTDTQFAGLCTNCHTKTVLNNTAAVTTANWKSMTRIHNSVAGWAMTTGTGGNVGNKTHAYTCSKCHTPHNARLPRLLVTNCLDVKHAGRVLSQATVPANTAAQTGTSGGRGRFPGGGGGAANIGTATNPGPWYFGSTTSGSTVPAAATTCHQSGTAGGTTFNATSQQWNTKSLW